MQNAAYLNQQNALYPQLNGWYTAGTLGTSQTITVTGNYEKLTIPEQTAPRARTNLDWLDERVNEIRVKL